MATALKELSFQELTPRQKARLIYAARVNPKTLTLTIAAIESSNNIKIAGDTESIQSLIFGPQELKQTTPSVLERTHSNDFHLFPENHQLHPEHTFTPNMLTPEMQEDAQYQGVLAEVKAKKSPHWEKNRERIIQTWQKKNNRIITPEEEKQLVENPESSSSMNIAEEKYRSTYRKEAHAYDEKERHNTSATSFEKDFIGKQYDAEAKRRAGHEIEGLKKKFDKKKITFQEYQAASDKIHKKWQSHLKRQFIKDFSAKAVPLAQTDPTMKEEMDQVRFGKAAKYYKKLRKLNPHAPGTTTGFTMAQIAILEKLRLNPSTLTPQERMMLATMKPLVHDHIQNQIETFEKTKKPKQPKRQHREEEEDKKKKNSVGKQIKDKIVQKVRDKIFEKIKERFEPKSETGVEQPETGIEGESPVESGDFSNLDPNTIVDSTAEVLPEAEMAAPEAVAPLATETTAAATGASGATAAGSGGAGAAVAATSPAWVPIALVVLAVILFIVIIIAAIVAVFNIANNKNNTIPGFSMTVDGPDSVDNGTTTTLNYTINIVYSLFDSIQITAHIPPNADCAAVPTTIVHAPDTNYTCNGQNDLIWNLDAVKPTSTNGDSKTYAIPVSFTVPTSTKNQDVTVDVVADDLTDSTQASNPVPGLTLTVSSIPSSIGNGGVISYVINTNYTGKDPSVTLHAQIPPHATIYQQATGQQVPDPNGILNWVLSDYPNPGTFYYKIKPDTNLNDSVLSNTVYATAKGNGTGATQNNIFWLNSGVSGEFPTHPEWIPGQCSQASLAEILNAYGGKKGGGWYTTEEVATISEGIGVWGGVYGNLLHSNPEIGITGFKQIWDAEAAYFHFNDNYIEQQPTVANLQYILDTYVNKGYPVITSAPNHWLVIYKSDDTYVYLLDSSPNFLTWADQQTYDSNKILNTPNHSYRPTKAEFVNGMKNNLFPYYWGGNADGSQPDVARTIVLTPK